MRLLAAAAIVLGVALAGCGEPSSDTARPPVTRIMPPPVPSVEVTSMPPESPVEPYDPDTCRPGKLKGEFAISGARQVTQPFCGTTKGKCAEWAAGDGGMIRLPGTNKWKGTVTFESKQLIGYAGPGSYNNPADFMATRIYVQGASDRSQLGYFIKDGKIDATVVADGSGSMNLTDWVSEAGEKVTVKLTWKCTDW
jgi:hypothetical protein